MRHLFTFILLFISVSLLGQGWSVSVEDRPNLSNGNKVFALHVKRADKEQVIKTWKKNLEKGNKVKIEQKDNYHHIKQIVHEGMAEDTLDVYSEIEEDKGGVNIYVSVQTQQKYLPSDQEKEKTLRVEKHLNALGKKIYEGVLEKELKKAEKKLASIESELKKNRNEYDNLKGKVAFIERKNEDLASEIKLIEGDLLRKNEEINAQKSTVSKLSTSPGTSLDAANEQLKTLENEKGKLKKEKERMHKSIFKNETEIRDLNYKSEKVQEEETRIKERVSKQGAVVAKVKAELDALKE